eukprot:11320542-Prorocentrum_lima.AAC.1
MRGPAHPSATLPSFHLTRHPRPEPPRSQTSRSQQQPHTSAIGVVCVGRHGLAGLSAGSCSGSGRAEA